MELYAILRAGVMLTQAGGNVMNSQEFRARKASLGVFWELQALIEDALADGISVDYWRYDQIVFFRMSPFLAEFVSFVEVAEQCRLRLSDYDKQMDDVLCRTLKSRGYCGKYNRLRHLKLHREGLMS